jgi:ATP-binding cassette, subfamily B, bacterial
MVGIGWETGAGVFLGFVAVTVSASLVPLVFALGLKPLVDGLFYQRTGDATLGAIICAVALVILVANPPASRWVTTRIRERSILVMQRRMLALSTAAPGLAHFERSDYWDRLQLLKRNFGDLLVGMANVLVGPLILVQLLVTAVVLARLQPLLLVLPALAVPAVWLSKRAEGVRRAGEERSAESRRGVQHLFSVSSSAQAGKEVRMYRLDRELVARHRELSDRVQRTTEAAAFRGLVLTMAGWVAFGLGYVAAVILVLRAGASGALTPGDVALTLTLASALVAVAGQVSALAGVLLRAVTVTDHYHWLEEQGAEVTRAGRKARAATEPVPARLTQGYELRDVTFTYPGNDRTVLSDINLRLPAGSVVALVGENGAGKTTLVKLLSRMYAPTSGQILVDDTDLTQFDILEYRRRLAAGFQDFVRFELLAAETVGIGDLPRLADMDAVNQALARANGQFVERLSAGLTTQLGSSWDGGVDLSGGEWQKLALARAMMREGPLLVIFDEPTASLDPQTEYALFERIAEETRRGAASGRVTVLVSHRFSTVRMADLIVVLEQGRVIEQGSHDELVGESGLYAELYELQARAYR